MDKVQKIREEVEKLKSQLLRGACSSQIVIETMCKEEAYNEVLAILDSTQEEPVSIWHDASEEPKPNMELICVGQYGNPLVLSSNSDSFKSRDISKWAYFNDLLNLFNVQRTVKNCKEPASNVWHDMSEVAENGRNIIIIDPKNFYGAVLRKGGSQLRNHNRKSYVKWAYIDDLLNLSNVEQTAKNLKEPASEELEKAEKFIDEHTKYCSNLAHNEELNGNVWEENTPWLTPDQARKAIGIAREETLLEVAVWINDTFIFSKQAKEDFSQTFNIMKELL